jgi:hypothetical protein
MSNVKVLSASINHANTSGHEMEDIEGLTVTTMDLNAPSDLIVALTIPLFYVTGCSSGQDQGVSFVIRYTQNLIVIPPSSCPAIILGGYTFPYQQHANGRLPITLTAHISWEDLKGGDPAYITRQRTVFAQWQAWGNNVAAHIDVKSSLTVMVVERSQ